MQEQPKWAQYAVILERHIKQIFTEDADDQIELSELDSEENLQAFFHALSTTVPCSIFNKLLGENKNHLEFNHTANLLCFGFMSRPGEKELHAEG